MMNDMSDTLWYKKYRKLRYNVQETKAAPTLDWGVGHCWLILLVLLVTVKTFGRLHFTVKAL